MRQKTGSGVSSVRQTVISSVRLQAAQFIRLRQGRAEYSKAYSWPSPAGRKKKAQRFNAGNKRPRGRVPSGTTEAHDRGAILSSLRDLACLRIGAPTLKRW